MNDTMWDVPHAGALQSGWQVYQQATGLDFDTWIGATPRVGAVRVRRF